jgi:ABC-type cobalt transport system substrate-binding protein
LKRIVRVLALLLCVVALVALAATNTFRNQTGATASGIVIQFSEEVRITSYDKSVFPTQSPASGEAESFTFSGGTLDAGGTFQVTWSPSGARVRGTKWITAGSASAAAPVTLSVSQNAKPEYDAIIGSTFDRASSDGIGGTVLIPNLGVKSQDLRMKYTTFLELLRRNTGNEPEAVRDPQAIVGPMDTLHHGWGSEITYYVVPEYNGMNKWVEQVIEEINVGLGHPYFREVQESSAEWVFGFLMYPNQWAADYRNERGVGAKAMLSSEGDPLSCRLTISGLFAFVEDFKTRLRKAVVQTVLLYKDYDPDLLSHLGYDETYFEKTGFSTDFLNLLTALGDLPNGRDFALDLNEVNRSPVAVAPPLIKARVGEVATLDGSGSLDVDGRVVSYSWVQTFPMKLGTDYVSDQVVALASASSSTATLTPEWPGNYRFQLVVADDAGACAYKTVDVEVAPVTPVLGRLRGVALGVYYDSLYQYYDEVVQWLVEHNVGAVTILPSGFLKTVHSTDIEFLASDGSDLPNGNTMSDDDLRALIEHVRAVGIKVMLVPIVNIYRWEASRWDIAPSSWAKWFESYDQFILHYAQIAAELDVEYFCVGVELAPTEVHTDEWRKLIRAVREICPQAAVTYESDTVYKEEYYTRVQFWDDLDFIGVSAYFGGSGSSYATAWGKGSIDPTSAEIEAQIAAVYNRTVARIAEQFGKPVLFIEAGCQSYDGANQVAWMNIPQLMQFFGVPRERITFDFRERIDYYEALGRFVAKTPEIAGVFFWERTLMDPWGYQKYHVIHTLEVREPPISEFIRIWYDYPEAEQ